MNENFAAVVASIAESTDREAPIEDRLASALAAASDTDLPEQDQHAAAFEALFVTSSPTDQLWLHNRLRGLR